MILEASFVHTSGICTDSLAAGQPIDTLLAANVSRAVAISEQNSILLRLHLFLACSFHVTFCHAIVRGRVLRHTVFYQSCAAVRFPLTNFSIRESGRAGQRKSGNY
jgi:hypothetical protein